MTQDSKRRLQRMEQLFLQAGKPWEEYSYADIGNLVKRASVEEQAFKQAMRDLYRFMVWVEMTAEVSELWSGYDDDGNEVPRYFVDRLGGFDKYEYLIGAIESGKLCLAWPEQ